MTSISILGTAYAKRLPLKYARHLRTIYTQTKNLNLKEAQNISLKATQIAQSILWSEKPPKGFEKYFPNSQKSSSTEKNEGQSQNPFDFKKFSSTGGGGSGSGGEKNSDDKYV